MASTAYLTRTDRSVAPHHVGSWIGWLIEDEGIHTVLNLTSTNFSRGKDAKFRAEFRLYQRRDLKPIGTFLTKEFLYGENVRVPMGEALELINLKSVQGLYFIKVWSTAHRDPTRQDNRMEPWFDYQSEDGRVYATLPGTHYKGGRVTSNKSLAYFPGALWTEKFTTRALILNPYNRAVSNRIRLFNTAGGHIESKEIVVAGKDFQFVRLDEALMRRGKDFLAPSGIGSVVFDMQFRLLTFIAIENIETGVLTCLDHTMPLMTYTGPLTIN